jgi:hypothetical protein
MISRNDPYSETGRLACVSLFSFSWCEHLLIFEIYSMPVEMLSITLKPASFFDYNPSMNVPGAKDGKSVPAFASGVNGVNGSGGCH